MFKVTDVNVIFNNIKTGIISSGNRKGQKWVRHAYKFMGLEDWFSHFVQEGTPLYPKGTILKEVTYEEDPQYGNTIKGLIVASIPKEAEKESSGGSGKKTTKTDLLWYSASYMARVEEARIGSLGAKGAENIALGKEADDIASAAIILFETLSDYLETGVKPVEKPSVSSFGDEQTEPLQDPPEPGMYGEEPPPPNNDDAPFTYF